MSGESTRKPVGLYALTGITSMIAATGFFGLTSIFGRFNGAVAQSRFLEYFLYRYGIKALLLYSGVPLLLLGILLILNSIKCYGGVLARVSELIAGMVITLYGLFILFRWFNFQNDFIIMRNFSVDFIRLLDTVIPNILNILLFWSISFYTVSRILWVRSIPAFIIGLFTIAPSGLFCLGSLIGLTVRIPSTFYFIIGPIALFSLGVLILVTAFMRQNIT